MQHPLAMKIVLPGVLALWAGAGSGPAAADGWPPVARWTPAVPVAAINTPTFAEGCPIETPDGLSVMFASTRSGLGNNDIWAADRTGVGAPWQAPRKLEAPISVDVGNDFCPTPFGRSLLFVSDRSATGTCGSAPGGAGDIYLSRQSPAGDWSEPVHLPCAPDGPNTAGGERSPSLVETWYGTFLFYSTNGPAGDHDIFVSRMRDDGSFGPGRVVQHLSSSFDDFMPNVRERDQGGYEIVFNSNRPSKTCEQLSSCNTQDVFAAHAWFLPGPWATPVNLGGNVNTAGQEQRATLSRDGKRLYFGRNGDIFVSERR